MVRKRAKQNKLCACGCNRAVKPSRIEAGKSWRILVVCSYLVFLTTACVVAAAQANTTWRPALAAALRAYVGGRGTRGVVAAALQTVEELEHGAAIGVGNPAGLHAHGDRFDDSALHVYMDLLLLGFLEWHVRLGFRQAAAWCRKLLNLFPGKRQWQQQRRCTVWALLDTTSVFLISKYVRRLQPPLALLSVVVSTVCFGHWKKIWAVLGTREFHIPFLLWAWHISKLLRCKKTPMSPCRPPEALPGPLGRLSVSWEAGFGCSSQPAATASTTIRCLDSSTPSIALR